MPNDADERPVCLKRFHKKYNLYRKCVYSHTEYSHNTNLISGQNASS